MSLNFSLLFIFHLHSFLLFPCNYFHQYCLLSLILFIHSPILIRFSFMNFTSFVILFQARVDFVSKERPYMGKDGLVTQISRLVFVARPSHFHRGKLRIKCVADITGKTLTKHSAFSHRPWERLFLGGWSHLTYTSVLVCILKKEFDIYWEMFIIIIITNSLI